MNAPTIRAVNLWDLACIGLFIGGAILCTRYANRRDGD